MKTIYLKITLILLLVLNLGSPCEAQNIAADLDSALTHSFNKPEVVKKPKFLFIPNKKIIKYNPVSLSFGGLMYFYQRVISPQILAGCPYEISCSNYSKAVINRYGVVKGIALTSYRLMRCNRLAAIDVHPLYFNSAGKIIDDPEQYHLK
jgi:putative component of membrane protein insertase Oxa1/YidC/SpoIIIJ protein YidD